MMGVKNKRGQITLFIIIGIVLLIAIIAFYLMSSRTNIIQQDPASHIKDADAKEVYTFVKDCLRDVSQEALFHFGYQGGKTNFFPKSYSYGVYTVPYYFYEGVSYMPDESEVDQKILSKYVVDNLPVCLQNYKAFPALKVEQGELKCATKLADESVVFVLDYPLAVFKGDKRIEVGPEFRFEYNVRLKEILSIARTIVQNQLKNELFIHWDYITDETNKGFDITAYTEKDNTIVYRILDLENELYEEKYLFQFANKFYIKETQ